MAHGRPASRHGRYDAFRTEFATETSTDELPSQSVFSYDGTEGLYFLFCSSFRQSLYTAAVIRIEVGATYALYLTCSPFVLLACQRCETKFPFPFCFFLFCTVLGCLSVFMCLSVHWSACTYLCPCQLRWICLSLLQTSIIAAHRQICGRIINVCLG